MHFHEHIDRLKKSFPPTEFRDPFTEATGILKKIEKRFIRVKDLQTDLNQLAQHCSHWAENMKNKTEICCVALSDLYEYLSQKLDPAQNYWTILASKSRPSAKHYLYDTQAKAIPALLGIWNDHFFIAHKKYEWLLFFEMDLQEKMVRVSASFS